MKTILAVGSLFLVAGMVRGEASQQVLDALQEPMESCAKQLQITPEEVETFVKNENLDEEMKGKSGCYSACILKHLNLLEDGVIKSENIQSVTEMIYSATPEVVPQKVEEMTQCTEKVAGITDECQLAYELVNCFK